MPTLNITLRGEFYDIGLWRHDDEAFFHAWAEQDLDVLDTYLRDIPAFEAKHALKASLKFPQTPNWAHARGMDARFGYADITVTDEDGAITTISTYDDRSIFDQLCDKADGNCDITYADQTGPDDYVYDEDDVYFLFQFSRGMTGLNLVTGFEGNIEIDGDFDWKKLAIEITQFESGQNVITNITYDGKDIVNTKQVEIGLDEWSYQHSNYIDVNSDYDADDHPHVNFNSLLAPNPEGAVKP